MEDMRKFTGFGFEIRSSYGVQECNAVGSVPVDTCSSRRRRRTCLVRAVKMRVVVVVVVVVVLVVVVVELVVSQW